MKRKRKSCKQALRSVHGPIAVYADCGRERCRVSFHDGQADVEMTDGSTVSFGRTGAVEDFALDRGCASLAACEPKARQGLWGAVAALTNCTKPKARR